MYKTIFIPKSLQLIVTLFLLIISGATMLKVPQLPAGYINSTQVGIWIDKEPRNEIEKYIAESHKAIVGLDRNLLVFSKYVFCAAVINAGLIATEAFLLLMNQRHKR